MEIVLVVLHLIEDLHKIASALAKHCHDLEGCELTLCTAWYFLSARCNLPARFCALPSSVRYISDCISSRSDPGLGASFCSIGVIISVKNPSNFPDFLADDGPW